MAETVTSKLKTGYRLGLLCFALGVVVLVAISANYCIVNRATFTLMQLTSISIFLIIWVYYCGRLLINSLIVVTTYPGGLEIYYIITKKRKSINYTHIDHISSVVVNGNNDSTNPMLVYTRTTVSLSKNEGFSFTDLQFSNYDELKESIRQHRFHLD